MLLLPIKGGYDDYRRPHQDQRPPDRGGYPNRGGRPPDRGGYPNGGGGPPDRDGGPPGGGYPGGGPLMEVEDALDPLEDKDYQAFEDHLGL